MAVLCKGRQGAMEEFDIGPPSYAIERSSSISHGSIRTRMSVVCLSSVIIWPIDVNLPDCLDRCWLSHTSQSNFHDIHDIPWTGIAPNMIESRLYYCQSNAEISESRASKGKARGMGFSIDTIKIQDIGNAATKGHGHGVNSY